MNTFNRILKGAIGMFAFLLITMCVSAQTGKRKSITVLNVDTKGVQLDPQQIPHLADQALEEATPLQDPTC